MDTTALTAAEKELALRSRLLHALLAANEQLRYQNSLLVSFIAQKRELYSASETELIEKCLGYSLQDKAQAHNRAAYSTTDSLNEATRSSYSTTDSLNETTHSSYSTTDSLNETTRSGYSTTDKKNGINETNYCHPETGSGISEALYPKTEKGTGITNINVPVQETRLAPTTLSGTLPPKIDTTLLPHYTVAGKLMTAIHYKGRYSYLENTAKLLLHLYNGGGGEYRTLKRATGLSEGGLAKLLMSLRKKGLIVNAGYQQPALTPFALSVLEQAWAEKAK